MAALAVAAGCRKAEVQAAAPAEAAPVRTELVQVDPRPFETLVAVTGTLVSSTRVDVKAETTGRITKFAKQEGDRVRAGEPVVWVDEENYKLGVRQAESSVEVAQAALDRARVMESHGRAEMERARNLLKSGGITDKDYKLAEVTERDARSQVSLAAAQLEQAKAALEVSRKRLRDAVIYAPVDGEIQKKFVNPGAYVEPPTAVFSLVDNRKLELESPVSSAELAPVRAGQRVSFSVNSYPGVRFEGRVIEIAPAVDVDSRAAKVRIGVGNADGKLRAGMFVEGEILTGVERAALLVPAGSLRRDDRSAKDSAVFVVAGGRAALRKVRLGRERDTLVEVVEGLKPGETIVAVPSLEIAEGVRVERKEAGRVSQ
jgi:RND family efflux transporter MFP subunit